MAEAKTTQFPVFSGSFQRAADAPLIDLGAFARGLRERWLGTLVCVIIGCGLVGFFLLRRPPVYAATSTLTIERSIDRVVDIKQVVDTTVDTALTDALLLTHIQQLHSEPFIARVAATFSLAEQERIWTPYVEKGSELAALTSVQRTEEILMRYTKVERTGRTFLINVRVRHRDPAVAQLVANRIADQYIASLLARSGASNDAALSFLSHQADELKTKLEAAEEKAQAYRERNNLVFLGEAQNVGVDRLRALNTAVTQARVARLALDARVAQIEAILNGKGDPRQLTSLPEFAPYADVLKKLDEQRAKRSSLAERYGRMHPLMVESDRAIEALERLDASQAVAALADVRNQRAKALIEENQLRSELTSAEQDTFRREQLRSGYDSLRREVDTTRETYGQIVGRLNETNVSSRLQNTNVKVIAQAGLPIRPVEPNQLKIVAILGLLGATLLVGYPWVAQARDKRIRGFTDVEGFLGTTLIGEVPTVAKIEKSQRAAIVARSLDQTTVEAFRGIYSQFRLSSKSKTSKIVLVTSTIPEEGKSFVACNLAAAFAAHGHRVLLVDADLRRPTLHTAFGLPNDNGILVWLDVKQRAKDRAVLCAALGIKEVFPGLSLLRAGGRSERLSEHLLNGTFQGLLRDLQLEYDLILVDSSPAGVFPDTEAFGGLADDLVYVCRYKGPERPHVQQTLMRLAKTEIPLRGVVVNAIPPGQVAAHYMSSYSHGAGRYRKGYGTKSA